MGVQRRLFQNDAACNGLFVEAGWRIYASLKWVNVGSGNGLSPVRRQAITWTNDYLLSIRPIGKKFSDFFFIEIQTFLLTKLHLIMSSAKVAAILSRPQCVIIINVLSGHLWQWPSQWNSYVPKRILKLLAFVMKYEKNLRTKDSIPSHTQQTTLVMPKWRKGLPGISELSLPFIAMKCYILF